MKKLFTGMLLLTLCYAVAGFGQGKSWQFVKVFPDTAYSWNTGVHGLAVDPDGKIWISAYGTMDSVGSGKVRRIDIFNPNGTKAAISGIKTAVIGGKTDTLFNSMRGMKEAADGNIVACFFDTYYMFNYKTGAAMRKVTADSNNTGIAPGFTAANEMVTGPVIPPANGIKLFDNTFTYEGSVVSASTGFSRAVEISKDGNNVYWPGYTLHKILIYHSDNGTLGPYALKDSIVGLDCESMCWRPNNANLLYVSGGTRDTVDYGPVPTLWSVDTWYGIDVTTKARKDSIKWNNNAYPYPTKVDLTGRPRAIGFSPSGDTAYVAMYNFNKAMVQMFVNKLTSVEPVNNAVPAAYTLSQNYPNPFNPTTEIQFTVPKGGHVSLTVYDMLGQEVATLVNENLAPGTFKTKFDAGKLSSGTYIYRLVTETAQITKKMMLVK